MQAVVKVGSSQALVTPGAELLVHHLNQTAGQLVIDQVLMLIDGSSFKIGQPYVTGAAVTARILGEIKGDKLRVATYKAKSRYRKVRGFRPQYTKIKIEDIKLASADSAAPQPASPKPASRKRVKPAP